MILEKYDPSPKYWDAPPSSSSGSKGLHGVPIQEF